MPKAAVLSLALALGSAACTGTAGFDFIEVHGALADGTGVSGHNLASAARVPSLLPPLGTVLALGAPFMGPEDLAGFRIEWQEANVAAGASYPSDPNGPVVFYVASSVPDGGAMNEQASVVNGGSITFNTVGSKITGAFAGLVLMRDGQTIITIDNGFFQATKP